MTPDRVQSCASCAALPTGGYHGVMAAELVQTDYVLTRQDRCDRCGAEAYVSVTHMDWPQELLFCGHHGSQHLPALEGLSGVWIHDERERLYSDVAAQKRAAESV